ncbi:MAG: ATP-binding protein [Thermodesulfobacteriota bacterium]
MNKKETIFHTVPDEEFINREGEIEAIYKLALETINNTTPSIYLYGKRKVGKTENLRRVYHRLLWEQDRVIPFYYTFSKEYPDISGFATDYLREFIKQYLGFIRKDPKLIRNNISLERLSRIVREGEYPGLNGLIENYYEHMDNRDYLEGLRNSLSAPYIVSMESFTRVFVMLDDFHRVKGIPSPEGKAYILGAFSEVFNNRFAPHLITGYGRRMLQDIFRDEALIGVSDIMELKGLAQKDVIILFENLCRLYNVGFLKEDVDIIVEQLACNPFYIKSLIRLAGRNRIDLRSLKDFQSLYLQEITVGSIGFYLSSILNTFVDEMYRKTAVKLLMACVETADRGLTTGLLGENISLDPEKTQHILKKLQDSDLIEIDSGHIKRIDDPVLRDFIAFTYSTVVKGEEPSFVKIKMAREREKDLSYQRSHTEEDEALIYPDEETGQHVGDNEFEMIIPMASDTELVAARAIEEIAKRANFNQDSIGQIKVALIEACINASEHSRAGNGKISLRFIIEHDKLIIYVQNKGRRFDPSLVAEPDIDKKIFADSKRGWGIKLMKNLMDEVKFEQLKEGTKLKMVKLLKREKTH